MPSHQDARIGIANAGALMKKRPCNLYSTGGWLPEHSPLLGCILRIVQM